MTLAAPDTVAIVPKPAPDSGSSTVSSKSFERLAIKEMREMYGKSQQKKVVWKKIAGDTATDLLEHDDRIGELNATHNELNATHTALVVERAALLGADRNRDVRHRHKVTQLQEQHGRAIAQLQTEFRVFQTAHNQLQAQHGQAMQAVNRLLHETAALRAETAALRAETVELRAALQTLNDRIH